MCVQCRACVCECVPVLYKHMPMGASPTFVYIMFKHVLKGKIMVYGGGGKGLNHRDNIA